MTQQDKSTSAVPAGFIRVADVFAAAKFQEMRGASEWTHDRVQPTWFPEIPGLEYTDTTELMAEYRLKAYELLYDNIDGSRHMLVLALSFDDKPFAIVQEGGRSGRDYRRRLVTDKAVLGEAAGYVIRYLVTSADFDRDTEEVGFNEVVPVEEIFDFYSEGTAEKLGYRVAQTRRDLYDMVGQGSDWLSDILSREEILMVAKGAEPAEHLRSGGTYYAFVRQLSDTDIAQVKHLAEARDDLGDAAIKAGKTLTLLVYRKLEKTPENFTEAVPL
jgi:hypothetical protein